jgi:hypothetical protein
MSTETSTENPDEKTKWIERQRKNTNSQTNRLVNPEELQLHHNHGKFLFLTVLLLFAQCNLYYWWLVTWLESVLQTAKSKRTIKDGINKYYLPPKPHKWPLQREPALTTAKGHIRQAVTSLWMPNKWHKAKRAKQATTKDNAAAYLCFSELPRLPSAGSRSSCFRTSLGCKPRSLIRASLDLFGYLKMWGREI